MYFVCTFKITLETVGEKQHWNVYIRHPAHI